MKKTVKAKAKRTTKTTEKRFSVSVHTIPNPRGFLTVTEKDALWRDILKKKTIHVDGAFVRLRPGPDVPDAQIDAVKEALRVAGALAVKVITHARANPLPEKSQAADKLPRTNARHAVLELIEKSTTKDREALLSLCESVLGEVGL